MNPTLGVKQEGLVQFRTASGSVGSPMYRIVAAHPEEGILMSIPSFTLSSGVMMPALGLGLWQTGSQTVQAVLDAFACGYRHIDTAQAYGNEQDVGRAVAQSGLARSKVFITTKLRYEHHGYESAIEAFTESLEKLNTPYVDLFLIHWPGNGPRDESWKALEQLYAAGKCKAIGVSNYTVRHLDEMQSYAEVMPMVNQIEVHPWLDQRETIAYCKEHNIAVTAYSPLARGKRMDDPVVTHIAQQHGKTFAQICLRWLHEQGCTVIPKSTKPDRIKENAGIFDFELSQEDRAELAELAGDYRTCWNPHGVA